MKRIVSLFLCAFMLITLTVPFTGFAAEGATNDYKLTCETRIDRCPEHTNETDPLPAGVGKYEDSTGLKMTGSIHYPAAVTISVPTSVENYTIKFKMALDYTKWDGQNIYYGFGQGFGTADKTAIDDSNFYTAYDPMGYVKNVYNLNMNPATRMYQLQNLWIASPADSDEAKLANWMDEGNAIEYSFYVMDGMFTGVSASATIDGEEVTVTTEFELKNKREVTSFDKFGIATRVKDGESGRAVITLSAVSVEYDGNVQKVEYPSNIEFDGEKIDLSAGREVPVAPALSFADDPLNDYIPGSVLHNVDFTNVRSFAETGYMFSKTATNDNTVAELTDEGLHIKTTDAATHLVPAGVSLPKGILNYTIVVNFRFVSQSQKYLVFAPAVSVSEDGAVETKKGDVCFRYGLKGGMFDFNEVEAGYTADQCEKIFASRDSFKPISIAISMYGLTVNGITVTDGTETVQFKGIDAKGLVNMNWGFFIGLNTDLCISSITMVAGEQGSFTELIWPGEVGANMFSTPASVLESAEKPPIGGEDTDPEVTTPDTPPITAPPASENTTTKAPEPSGTAQAPVPDKGCKSMAPLSAIVAVAVLASVPLISKKKHD